MTGLVLASFSSTKPQQRVGRHRGHGGKGHVSNHVETALA